MGLNNAVAVGFADGDYEVYVSSGTTVVEKETHTEWKTITGNQYMGNSYSYVAELPRYVIQKGETDTDPNTLVVGTMGVARMGNWNESYVEHLAALVSEHVPDVLCLQSISQNASGPYGGYGDKDLVGMLQNLLGYQYVAYTPAWYCDTDYNLETGDGTHGNMILSRYPVEYIETINIQEGAIGATPEGRSVGHVLVDVEGVKVDVYYTEFEGSKVDANLAAFAEKFAPKTDKVILAGIFRTSAVTKFETALNKDLEIAVEGHDYENIFISENLALSDTKVEGGVGNMDSFVVTKVYLDGNGIPEYVLTVNNGTGSGKYQAGTSVTVTAKAPSRIEVFTGWTVEKGNVTIADPTLEEITIVMPAEEVVLTANYAKKEAEREPTGKTLDLDVAMVPVFRFARAYKDNAESINKALLDLNADVLVLVHVDQNSSGYNNYDVPGALTEAMKDVYPYTYYSKVWTVGGGYNGHMIFSKYEILETEMVWQIPDGSSSEARAATRAMLNVEGTTVDMFYMCMGSPSEWDGENGLAAMIKNSKADLWIATGDMKYASPEKSGIEAKLGETISAAFEHYAVSGGGYHMFNIISSNNCTFSNVKREACTDRFGANADPLYSATVTMPLYQDKVEETALNVALVPAFRFANSYAANADSIHKALVDLGADVLVVAQIDKNSSNYNNMDVPGAIAEALKDVYPYSYWVDAWEIAGGTCGHLMLSKYEIKETEKIVLNAGTPDNSSNEGRAFGRAMLAVNGKTVDVFFGWMSSNYWSTFGSIVGASKADAWVVTGHMSYAGPEFSGVQTAIGEPISAAFEHYLNNEGGYHMCNILSSGNGTFSGAKYEKCNDRFGANADPLYQATVTFTFA
jgi:endonuclease/exonuclease/phosphatase family metal-dependent hydrolase